MSRILFTIVLISLLFSGTAFAEDVAKPVAAPKPESCEDQDLRSINLSKIEYRSPDNWSVWINGQEIKQGQIPPKEVVELAVKPTSVKIKWFDICLNGVVNLTLHPEQTYFIGQKEWFPATTTEQAAIDLLPEVISNTPLNQLGMSDESLILWAEIAASQIMTFNFNDSEERFKLAKETYFNEAGFKKFSDWLKSSLMKSVTDFKQIFTSYANYSSEPKYSKESRNPYVQRREAAEKTTVSIRNLGDGRYTVDVRVSLIVIIRAGSKKNSRIMNILMTIQRVPHKENPTGLVIIDWRPE